MNERPFRRKIFLLNPDFPSYGICGSRGAGKSVLLEFIEEWYYHHNYVILDWFGSIDHENAYWCIPESMPIGRWDQLDKEDSSKLIAYIKARFKIEDDPSSFVVSKEDDKTILCTIRNDAYKIKLRYAQSVAILYKNHNPEQPKGRRLYLYKNDECKRVVYGRKPDRKEARVVGYPVLIILPKTTEIKQRNYLCSCGVSFADHEEAEVDGWKCEYNKQPMIKTITDDTPVKEIVEQAHNEKRICVFNRGFYGDQKDAYRSPARMMKELPFLILRGTFSRNTCFCIGFREAGQIAPSGLKGMKGDYETNVKRELQTFIREARHLRSVLCLDFQRSSDIAASIASQRDFLFIKKSAKDLMPDHIMWLWDTIEYKRAYAEDNLEFGAEGVWPGIPQLKPWESYVLFPDSHFEKRFHGMASFHRKRPNDVWSLDARCDIVYLDKKDLDKDGIQKKILTLSKKREDKTRLEETLKEADKLHEDGYSWPDLAKKYGWLDKDTGFPSDDRLRMAVKRWKDKQDEPSDTRTK
jgi:hypothetical protein